MMLTCTRAWRRSRVTSTPVTVTRPFTRGSFTPSVRNIATASRIASDTRSGRREFIEPQETGSRKQEWNCLVGGAGLLQRARYLFLAVTLDHVTDLDVIEVLDADAALVPFLDLLHVILEPSQ